MSFVSMQWKSNGAHVVPMLSGFSKYIFCALQKKSESHTGLESHDDEQIMYRISNLADYTFNKDMYQEIAMHF